MIGDIGSFIQHVWGERRKEKQMHVQVREEEVGNGECGLGDEGREVPGL